MVNENMKGGNVKKHQKIREKEIIIKMVFRYSID